MKSRCIRLIQLHISTSSVSVPDHKLIVMRCSWWQSLFIRRAHSRNASHFAPVVLRPYQEHCLDVCARALRSGVSRIGVSLPTGSGKTTVFISLLSRISSPASNPAAQRSLIIVNSIELARQSAVQVAHLFPTWSVEIEQGTKHKASGNADV
jgi:ATP-dependent helicase IRC3